MKIRNKAQKCAYLLTYENLWKRTWSETAINKL